MTELQNQSWFILAKLITKDWKAFRHVNKQKKKTNVLRCKQTVLFFWLKIMAKKDIAHSTAIALGSQYHHK